MKVLHIVAFVLLIVGGLNWLLFAFGYNLVELIFGGVPGLATIVYVLVGLSALLELFTHRKNCRMCSGEMSAGQMAR